jgi:hypothetical protein
MVKKKTVMPKVDMMVLNIEKESVLSGEIGFALDKLEVLLNLKTSNSTRIVS